MSRVRRFERGGSVASFSMSLNAVSLIRYEGRLPFATFVARSLPVVIQWRTVSRLTPRCSASDLLRHYFASDACVWAFIPKKALGHRSFSRPRKLWGHSTTTDRKSQQPYRKYVQYGNMGNVRREPVTGHYALT
jgi:hypothetical protein